MAVRHLGGVRADMNVLSWNGSNDPLHGDDRRGSVLDGTCFSARVMGGDPECDSWARRSRCPGHGYRPGGNHCGCPTGCPERPYILYEHRC